VQFIFYGIEFSQIHLRLCLVFRKKPLSALAVDVALTLTTLWAVVDVSYVGIQHLRRGYRTPHQHVELR
jgi:hypothetical protein